MNRCRHHKIAEKARSRVLLVCLLLCAGCGEGAKLVRSDDRGGIVTYPYREEVGHMVTKFRGEAIALIEQQCPRGYQIVREGEARGRGRIVQSAAGAEVVAEHRWAMQFSCQ